MSDKKVIATYRWSVRGPRRVRQPGPKIGGPSRKPYKTRRKLHETDKMLLDYAMSNEQ